MTWNMLELNNECNNKRIILPEYLLPSITNKFWRFHYFMNNAENKYNSLFRNPKREEIDHELFSQVAIEIEADVEAALSVLDTIPDIIAQVINMVLLEGRNPEGSVTLDRIRGELLNHTNYPALLASIINLLSSLEFTYLRAFVNTVKHRRLLDFDFMLVSGEGTRNEMGFRILPFQYNGHDYAELWVSDVNSPFYERFLQNIMQIGSQVNIIVSNPLFRPTYSL